MRFSSKQVFGGSCCLSVCVFYQVIVLVWMILISTVAGRHREMDPVMTMHKDYIRFYPRQSYCLKLLEVLEDTGGFYGVPVLCQPEKCKHYNIRGKYCASNGRITKTFSNKCYLCASSCHELNRWNPAYRVIHEGKCTESDIQTASTSRATTREPTTTPLTTTRRHGMPTTRRPTEATIEIDHSTVKHITKTPVPTEQKLSTTVRPIFTTQGYTPTTDRPRVTTGRPKPISTTHISVSTSDEPGSSTQTHSSTTYRTIPTPTLKQITTIMMNTLSPFKLDFQTNVTLILAPTTTPQVLTTEDSSTTESQTTLQKPFVSTEASVSADQTTSTVVATTISLKARDTTERVTQNSTILTEQLSTGATESTPPTDQPFKFALLPIKDELREAKGESSPIRSVMGEQHCTAARQSVIKNCPIIKLGCPFSLKDIPLLPKFL